MSLNSPDPARYAGIKDEISKRMIDAIGADMGARVSVAGRSRTRGQFRIVGVVDDAEANRRRLALVALLSYSLPLRTLLGIIGSDPNLAS